MRAAGVILVGALAVRCSRFGSSDPAGGAAGAAATTFYCPAPAGSCAFREQQCCYTVTNQGNTWVGHCIDAGDRCDTQNTVLCDSPGPCQALYDSSAARCCTQGGGALQCVPPGTACDKVACSGPYAGPTDCVDAGTLCNQGGSGFYLCAP
jgi:hypothetical protein